MNKDEEKNNDESIDTENKKSHNTSASDDDFIDEDEENAPQIVIKKLREKLKKCEAERMEYLSGWQRSRADYVNQRKEDEANRKSFLQFAESALIDDLLPVLSHFENAISNKTLWESVSKEWRVGIEQIYKELLRVLQTRGLSKIESLGETFNSEFHEAVETIKVDEVEKNHKIISVRENGFKLKDKVVKPARVVVGEFKN